MNIKKPGLIIILVTLQFTLFSFLKGERKPVLFPNIFKSKPKISSPYIFGIDGSAKYREYVTIRMPNGYAVADVTQEDGEIYSCMHSIFGKGQQLRIAKRDFPALGMTGLHSEEDLDKKKYITGRKLELINYLARPGRFSRSGFIAAHEDIISVLKRDNRTVRKMGLKHSHLAKPLFHIWNIIQGNYIRGRWAKDITIFYNGSEVILNAEGGKGYQESIFHDEIEGRWNISIRRQFSPDEIKQLNTRFGHLGKDRIKFIQRKLSRIDISEMNPFYIQRYGFYEGATPYRADPISIAFIFGLKNLNDVTGIFGNHLLELVGVKH